MKDLNGDVKRRMLCIGKTEDRLFTSYLQRKTRQKNQRERKKGKGKKESRLDEVSRGAASPKNHEYTPSEW